MKLWLKVSIISIAVLLAVVAVCGTLLILHSRDSILQLTKEQALAQQGNLNTSFSEMTNYYSKDEANPVVRQSAAKYCFSRFADETAVLVWNNETLFSSVSINPEQILPLNGKTAQKTFLGEIQGRNILIVGSTASVQSDSYSVYIVKDVTSVYNSIASLAGRFAVICSIGIAMGMVFIILLVHRASKPLIKLKNTTHRIAVGDYAQRAETSSNDEIGELAADFNAMAEAVQTHIAHLEETAKRQQLFIGGLTHEFKTPMTSMLIHTDTLLTTNLSIEEARNSLLHINNQCHWLERLTKKLLQLITLGETLHAQPECVPALLEDVAQSMYETLHERNTPLIIECNVASLQIDYDLMKSLLINLVDNASKASEAGQTITIRAYDSVIEVEDHGKGIPPEEIAHITDAFYMVDRSRSKAKGGSGLGLALAKQIADAHHAKLQIKSTLGSGTIVQIFFPDNKTLIS